MSKQPKSEHILVYALPNGATARIAVRIDSVDAGKVTYSWRRVGEVDPRLADVDLKDAARLLAQIEKDVAQIAGVGAESASAPSLD